jgi:hypothetical protein
MKSLKETDIYYPEFEYIIECLIIFFGVDSIRTSGAKLVDASLKYQVIFPWNVSQSIYNSSDKYYYKHLRKCSYFIDKIVNLYCEKDLVDKIFSVGHNQVTEDKYSSSETLLALKTILDTIEKETDKKSKEELLDSFNNLKGTK